MSMFKMGQARKYRSAEGDEGSGGVQVDLNNPEIQKLLKSEVEKEVAGLKNKNSELLGKFKEAQEKMKQFEGVDFEKIKYLQNQLETNEEARLLAEGKIDDVVARRVELRDKEWENKYSALDGRVKEYEGVLKQKEEKLKELVIDGQIREAFMQLGFEPSALKLVTKEARDVFIMNEDGTAVPRDYNGNIIYGKDAKTPISASQWLEAQADSMPWLRGASKGAGTQANAGLRGKVDTSKLTATERIAEGLRNRGM